MLKVSAKGHWGNVDNDHDDDDDDDDDDDGDKGVSNESHKKCM